MRGRERPKGRVVNHLQFAKPNSNLSSIELVNLRPSSMADETPNLTLYSYWRSSCAFRARIALNLKGLRYDYKAVQLDKGIQYCPEFKKLNPSSSVPVLVDGDSVIADSLAIILYLEDKYPQSPLLPSDPHKRAINFQAATIVSSGIQPFQNFSGLMDFVEPLKKILGGKLSAEQGRQLVIYHIKKGFAALEDILKGHAGKYATGDEVSLADVFLGPQIDAAIHRFSVDMDEFPLLKRLNEAYFQLPAFVDAIPTNQPDTPENLK